MVEWMKVLAWTCGSWNKAGYVKCHGLSITMSPNGCVRE